MYIILSVFLFNNRMAYFIININKIFFINININRYI